MENNNQPSEGELDILQVIWDKEPVTVRQVHEIISAKKQVRYTTTLKQIQRMTDKGMLIRSGTGKTHLYKAKVQEKSVQKNFYQKLVNSVFKGSRFDLVMHALGSSKASEEEIAALEKFLEQQKIDKESKK